MEPIRLTRKQVREVDRIAIEEYGIPGVVLMENAARGAAEQIIRHMGRTDFGAAIVCGSGNNGGDGFAVARHLHNQGVYVVLYFEEGKRTPDCEINHQIAARMNLTFDGFYHAEEIHEHAFDLVIDSLFGTGLTRAIEGELKIVVECMNEANLPVIAIDIPSGLDCDTGEPLGACVQATKTVTFVAEKIGFANKASRAHTGEIVVTDIGAPREIVQRVLRETGE